jgi:hypothetical protein
MRSIAMLVTALALGCGGAATPPPKPAHAIETTTSTSVAPSPTLFTGAFEVESMTDGKDTLVMADQFRKWKVRDGRMTWEIGPDSFKIGMWTAGALDKLSPSDIDPSGYAELCRTSASVSAHWEGATFVLASPVVADGSGGVVRITKKTQRGVTSTDKVQQVGSCNASFAGTRIEFEIVAKDDAGPTRVRAKAPGVTLTLVRGTPIASADPGKAFDSN